MKMKKSILLLVSLCVGVISACSNIENIEKTVASDDTPATVPSGSGTTETDETTVYVCGFNGKNYGYWKNREWVPLSGEAIPVSFYSHNDDVYIGGLANDGTNSTGYGYWKNDSWVGCSAPSGFVNVDYPFLPMCMKDDSLYLACSFRNSSNIGRPAIYHEGTWSLLPTLTAGFSSVMSTIEANGSVYVGGYCDASTSGTNVSPVPGYWIDESWHELPSVSLGYTGGFVYTLQSYGFSIYAGGTVYDTNDVSIPGYWINDSWKALSRLSNDKNGWVYSLSIDKGIVYALGGCTDASGKSVIGYWKDGVWNPVLADLYETDGQAYKIFAFQGNVYIQGNILNSANESVPVVIKNGVVSELPVSAENPMGVSYDILVK
jgi:hypothetical protein